MKTAISKRLALTAVLILHLAAIGLTQTNLFYSFSGAEQNKAYPPSYPLGQVTQGTTLTIELRLVGNPTGYILDQPQFYPILVNSQFEKIVDLPLLIPYGCNSATTSCSITYKTTNLVAGDLYLQITTKLLSSIGYLPRYELAVSSNGTLIFKGSDVLRKQIIKYIYISQARIVKFKISPDLAEGEDLKLELYPTDPADQFCSEDCETAAIESTPTLASGVNTYDYTLETGYYVLKALVANPVTNVFLSYSTDPYVCPYNSQFPDVYSVFQGCVQPRSDPGLPCINYNSITATCISCLSGYYLQEGVCFFNITCAANQYLRYGKCLLANPLCASFNNITGACLTCQPGFNLNGSECFRIVIVCQANQFIANFTCVNASSTCATFNSADGSCITCKFGFVLSGPSCIPIVLNCNSRQYQLNFTCIDIDPTCSTFQVATMSCSSCVFGYYISNNACTRIQCPLRQVPSKYGLFCVSISPYCDGYDTLTGACTSCSQQGQTIQTDGSCAQAVNALAGCMGRQALGFGPCVGAQNNCAVYNLVTGDCNRCNPGYYLDYTGVCSQLASCSNRQYQINGACYDVSSNCNTFSSTNGLCLTCINGLSLQGGICTNLPSCSAQQYLNSNGACVNVSPLCSTFNPSNGFCLSCLNVSNTLSNGICCPSGSINNGGVCAPIQAVGSAAASQSGSSCRVVHPTLNYCLSCNRGFTLSAPMFGICIQLN